MIISLFFDSIVNDFQAMGNERITISTIWRILTNTVRKDTD